MECWIAAAIALALIAGAAAAPPSSSLPVIPGGAESGENSSSSSSSSGGGGANEEGTVPSLPVEWQQAMSCDLHFGGLSFGGLMDACAASHHHHQPRNLRSRCCPVLASWLYAAQAETTLEAVSTSSPAASAPNGSSPGGSNSASAAPQVEMPVPPDDSAVCAAGLQQGLHSHGVDLPMLNQSCDLSLCFCGIRLQQTAALSCPLPYFLRNRTAALPSQAPFLRRLQTNCSDSSLRGCSSCISALDNAMVWIEEKAVGGNKKAAASEAADCRMMGLMWLLSTNRTRFIPTVSTVLRELYYSSSSSGDQRCSSDDLGLPLALDSGRSGPADDSSSIPLAGFLWTSSSSSSITLMLVLLSQLWWVRF